MLALAGVAAGLLAGCSQSAAASPTAAGQFFRRVGPVTLIHHQPERRREAPAADDEMFAASEVARMPDSKIRLDLGMELADAEIPLTGLEVAVDEQRVILRGRAQTLRARDRAEVLARSHPGVRGVDNRLQVDRPGGEGGRHE